MRPFSTGISLLEVLVSVAIVVLVTVFGLQSLTKYAARQALLTDTAQVVSMLREARERTLQSDGGYQYGVRITATSSSVFRGATYTPATSQSEHVFSARVTATSTDLGLPTDILFSRLSGTTLSNGGVTLYVRLSTTTSRSIVISSSGSVSTE